MCETLSLTVGRSAQWYGYEYVLSCGDVIVARKEHFKTYSQAKRAGLKMADTLLATPFSL
tara:strand:+ start:223 stop:402 length:180 start_codon:yes stop_codon:yes gene_type:complete